ncbi:unnamed protein product [Symbiodinium sp. CCMP2456]|nr:unnamed protein product [Symbiodinium sp. CCMP2456]
MTIAEAVLRTEDGAIDASPYHRPLAGIGVDGNGGPPLVAFFDADCIPNDGGLSLPRGSTTPAIQAALNVTRKAEQKVLKLREAHKAAGVKWSEFEAKMKEAFRRERSRFSRDLERLDKEILEAEEAQELARMGLRAAFVGESRPVHPSGDVDMSGGPDVEAVFAEWAREDSSATDAMVRRALGASLVTPTRPTTAAPRTPHQERAVGPPGLVAADAGVAAFDPYSYVPSPVATPPGTGLPGNACQPPMIRPSAERPAVAPTPPPSEPPPGPDAAPEAYGKSPTLQERLHRRRALEPFGMGRPAQAFPEGMVSSGLDPAATLQGGSGLHSVRIVNDDDELRLEAASSLTMVLSNRGFCRAFGGALLRFCPRSMRFEAQQGHCGPFGLRFLAPVWLMSLPSTHAMARPLDPDAPPAASRAPHALHPDELTFHVGAGYPEVPWLDADRARRTAESLCLHDARWPPSRTAEGDDRQMLGVYVYTPYYKPQAVAVPTGPNDDLRKVLDVICDCMPGTPDGVMDSVVPLQPQRFSDYLSVIRFSSLIRHVGDGQAAVVADLSRVGGHYFATVLPRTLSHSALLAFLGPLTNADLDSLRFFVGCRSRPWPKEALVTLNDGDVVTAVPHVDTAFAKHRAEALEDKARWGPMHHFHNVELHHSVCVLYRNERYCVQPHHHYGVTIVDHVMARMNLSPGRVSMCTFHVPDLDVQGHFCPQLVAVFDVPPLADTDATRERQDYFTLCDFRPLGLKPACVHSNVPKLHIPSIMSDNGVELPQARRIGVHGGRRKGDYVSIQGSSILLFYAEELDTDSSSSSPGPRHPAWPMPREDGDRLRGPPPPAPMQPQHSAPPPMAPAESIDTSAPAGHSWNAVADYEASFWTAQDAPSWDAAPVDNALGGSHGQGSSTDAWEAADMPGVSDAIPTPESRRHAEDTPPGPHSFPAPLEVPPPSRVASDHSAASASGLTEVRAFIYAPAMAPEMLNVLASLPCSVATLLQAVQADRDTDLSMHFPQLIPVTPQPSSDALVAIATPDWQITRPIVLIDCSRVGKSLFAILLFPRLNRESLLLAAGFPADADLEVYVHGLSRPLQIGQTITLTAGILVSLLPPFSGAPAVFDLQTKLELSSSWDPRADIPGPGCVPGQFFWVLTDAQPTLFEVKAGRRGFFREDLAAHLQIEEHKLVLKTASPPVRDCLPSGFLASGVLVATEAISRLLCPPSRKIDSRLIVFIDARRILQGFDWFIVCQPWYPVQRVVDRFSSICPAEYLVSITGADIAHHGNEVCFVIADGQVLQIAFVEDMLDEEASAPPPDSPGPDERDHTSHGEGPPAAGSGSPESKAVISSAPWQANERSAPSAVTAVENAQLATEQLGFQWPLMPPDPQFPLLDDSDVPPTEDQEDSVLVDTIFVILAPDYQMEVLEVALLLPQGVETALEVVDTCRHRDKVWVFPRLVPVWPQPSLKWAVLIMTPAWLQRDAVVCLDLSAHDGRVFASWVPRRVTRASLLAAAGLHATSALAVFVPDHNVALGDDEEFLPSTGQCFRFAPVGHALPPAVSLSHMLSSPFAWEKGPPFPLDTAEPCYCSVGDVRVRNFILHPHRSTQYRSDLAALFQLNVLHLVLTPSDPRQEDAACFGRPSQAVVAVGQSFRREPFPTGLLDCRQLLWGWRRLPSDDGWINVRQIQEGFEWSVPHGWTVLVQPSPPTGDWLRITDGQVSPAPYDVSLHAWRTDPQPPVENSHNGAYPSGPSQPRDSAIDSVRQESTARNFCGPSAVQFEAFTIVAFVCGCLGLLDAAFACRAAGQLVATCGFFCLCPRVAGRHSSYLIPALFCIGFLGGPDGVGVAGMQLFPPMGSPATPACAPGVDCITAVRTPSRPVATPCRTSLNHIHRLPVAADNSNLEGWYAADDSGFCSGNYRTLLEEAAGRTDCTAFYLTATLIEALVEHFTALFGEAHPGNDGVGRATVSNRHTSVDLTDHASTRVVLRLPALIDFPIPDDRQRDMTGHAEPELFDLDGRQCLLPCSMQDLASLTHTRPFAALQGPPGDVPQASRFDEWVTLGQVGRSPAPGEILVLTTDGSFSAKSGQAGWAVCLSAVSSSTHELPGTFLGCIYGSMDMFRPFLSPGSRAGAATFDAYLAEVGGLFWAAVASLQLPGQCAILFRADNISALDGVAGKAYMRDHPLCVVARSFFTALRGLSDRPIHFQHVYGHAGDCANELADGLAFLGSTGRPQSSLLSRMTFFHGGLISFIGTAALMAPFLRAVPADPPAAEDNTDSLAIHVVTYNVLSLLGGVAPGPAAGLHGAIGRTTLLANALEVRGVHLAGLQECRTPPGTYKCQRYHRFASGCDTDVNFGVELWVASNSPFHPRTVAVLHAEPTVLLASMLFRQTNVRVLVGHAPHRAHSEEARASWWQKVGKLCRAFSQGQPWLFLLDGNCRLGNNPSRAVGSHQPDPEDLSGAALHALALELDLWFPATFSEVMRGDGGTLCLHRNGALARSDFVGVPLSWRAGECQAWVDPGISTGHACIDHFAACFSANLKFPRQLRARRPVKIDVAALSHPDNADAVQTVLHATPRPDWKVDVSEHAAVLVDHLYRSLARLFPVALDWTRVRCAFLAWKPGGGSFCTLFTGKWLWDLRHKLALSCLLLHRAGGALRHQCRADRAAYFVSVADEIQQSPAGSLHRSVKKVLKPKRFRRTTADPLPLLYTKNGTVCGSAADAQTAWREHFSALEDGVPTSADALAASCRAWHTAFNGTDLVEIKDVPTIETLAQSFRATAAAKACGPDMLPPALCHFFSADMAQLFWPVMLKTTLCAAEAVGLKGILVQSCISKAIHRAFLAYTRAAGQASSILFVDLAAAYYSVVRETILGADLGDRSVSSIAATLGLTDADLQVMQSHIADQPVLCEQGSSSLFVELARELHSHTWFVLANDTTLVRTHRGTRPGGALADVIFNLLFGRVLVRRSQKTVVDTAPTVTWTGTRSPFPAEPCGAPCQLAVQDVVFADDLASFVTAPEPGALRKALGDVAAATLDVLPEHGLTANLGPTKTAAIVSVHGRGAREARRELFTVLRGKLPVWPENSGVVHLELVTSYKHLGSVLSWDGSLLSEIKHRMAAGRTAFREGKPRLFACKRIDISKRSALFRSHVLSAILSGCGTWPVLRPSEWKAFSGGIISLYRQLLGLHAEAWRVTESQILSRTGLPCPRSLLSAERLRFLLLMVRSGPDFAWALMQRFAAFTQGLCLAADWLLEAIGGCTDLGGIVACWPQWEAMMLSAPGRFKGLLKRAELWHIEICRIRAACETFGRTVWPPTPPSDATDQELYDLVAACIAPLPVLRCTLEEWRMTVSNPVLASACSDVLLILRPEHLCDKVAGKADEAENPSDTGTLRPYITPARFAGLHPLKPVCWSGRLDSAWIQNWGLDMRPPVEIAVDDLRPGSLPDASGFCISFPAPPSALRPLLQPSACPVHLLRGVRQWIEWVFCLSGRLVQLAMTGIPVRLAYPVNACDLRPFSDWLLQLQGEFAEEDAFSLCFTCEFVVLQ